jgi:hypothetical protein
MKYHPDGIGVEDILKLIPEELLLDLARETEVDYQVKKLYGQNVFNLLLYGLINENRLGLRALQDFYNSEKFKALFNLPPSMKTAKYNSISARLSTINVDFFEKAYEAVYEQCSMAFDESTLATKYKITRVDSTMVCQSVAKLNQGMNVGRKKDGKKQIKYTVGLTDMFPSSVEVFTQQQFISENKTIPSVIQKNIDQSVDNVFVFDRGVSSRDVFCDLDDKNCSFVTRLKASALYETLDVLAEPIGEKIGNLTIKSDRRVNLYRSGKHIVDHDFRILEAVNEQGKLLIFLTNRFDLTREEIISIYKHRWDIEVFFRFIKQELNFSHLINQSENGMKVILYMTLITAMLILIYKKINNIGYKTAVRRFQLELEGIIIKMLNTDPNTVFR